MTLFRQFIARALRRDPARGLVTVAGLTLGVAVVVAIRLANTASVRGFESALDVVAGPDVAGDRGGGGRRAGRSAGRHGVAAPVRARQPRHRSQRAARDDRRRRPPSPCARGRRAARPAVPGVPVAAVLAAGASPAAPGAARRPARLHVDCADRAVRAASRYRRRGAGAARRRRRRARDGRARPAARRGARPGGGRAARVAGHRGRAVAVRRPRLGRSGRDSAVRSGRHRRRRGRDRGAAAGRPPGAAARATGAAGRADARRLPLQPERPVLDRAGRRPVPGLQHRRRLGHLASRRDRRPARPRRDAPSRARPVPGRGGGAGGPRRGAGRPRGMGAGPRRGGADLDHRQHPLRDVAGRGAAAGGAGPGAGGGRRDTARPDRGGDAGGGGGGGHAHRRGATARRGDGPWAVPAGGRPFWRPGSSPPGGACRRWTRSGGSPVFGLGAALAVVFGAAALVPVLLEGLRRRGRALLAGRFRIEGLLAHANLSASVVPAGRLGGGARRQPRHARGHRDHGRQLSRDRGLLGRTDPAGGSLRRRRGRRAGRRIRGRFRGG